MLTLVGSTLFKSIGSDTGYTAKETMSGKLRVGRMYSLIICTDAALSVSSKRF